MEIKQVLIYLAYQEILVHLHRCKLINLPSIFSLMVSVFKRFNKEEKMGTKFGIDNLKKVIDLGVDVEALTVHMVKNGANWAQDLKDSFDHLPGLISEVKAVIDGGAQLPLEIKDLDAEEAAALVAYVGAKLICDGTKAQAIVAACLQIAGHVVVDAVALTRALRS